MMAVSKKSSPSRVDTSKKSGAQGKGDGRLRDKFTKITRVNIRTYEKAMKDLEKH